MFHTNTLPRSDGQFLVHSCSHQGQVGVRVLEGERGSGVRDFGNFGGALYPCSPNYDPISH